MAFQTGLTRSYSESKLDVLYMHFDRVDEIYAMVKSN